MDGGTGRPKESAHRGVPVAVMPRKQRRTDILPIAYPISDATPSGQDKVRADGIRRKQVPVLLEEWVHDGIDLLQMSRLNRIWWREIEHRDRHVQRGPHCGSHHTHPKH